MSRWNIEDVPMARREVTCVLKYVDKEILAVGNKDRKWSPRFKTNAIRDIEKDIHSYYVNYNGIIVDIEIIMDKNNRKFLRTNPEDSTKYNLHSLPICQSY